MWHRLGTAFYNKMKIMCYKISTTVSTILKKLFFEKSPILQFFPRCIIKNPPNSATFPPRKFVQYPHENFLFLQNKNWHKSVLENEKQCQKKQKKIPSCYSNSQIIYSFQNPCRITYIFIFFLSITFFFRQKLMDKYSIFLCHMNVNHSY